jgi:glycosyltransferase involved in cell wall biosynthesis
VKISIVTLSFNQGRYLERAIRSVLGQRPGVDLEYIVVDPGSKDGSREIIERYRSSIDHVVTTPDAGPADGLNKGLALCTGDLFGYLNADDTLLPGALRSVVDAFQARPRADVVHAHGYLTDSNDRILRRCYADRYSVRMAARGLAFVLQPSTFFRRRALQLTDGFNVENRIAWDAELLLDMALRGARIERIDAYWSTFRLHPEGITGSGSHADAHTAFLRRMFRRVHGRDGGPADALATLGLRVLKHLSHPRAAIERLRFGPVSGREIRVEAGPGSATD